MLVSSENRHALDCGHPKIAKLSIEVSETAPKLQNSTIAALSHALLLQNCTSALGCVGDAGLVLAPVEDATWQGKLV